MYKHLLRLQELNCCTFLGCRVIDLDTDLCTRFFNSLGQMDSQRGTQTGVSFSDMKLQIRQSTATVARLSIFTFAFSPFTATDLISK